MKCKCGKKAIGYIGLTGTKQEPKCKDCIEDLEEEDD